jgi:hypothetical protein
MVTPLSEPIDQFWNGAIEGGVQDAISRRGACPTESGLARDMDLLSLMANRRSQPYPTQRGAVDRRAMLSPGAGYRRPEQSGTLVTWFMHTTPLPCLQAVRREAYLDTI